MMFRNSKLSRSVSALIALSLIVALNATGLFTIGSTVAYFVDTEESLGNLFLAGNVDFLATSTAWDPALAALNLQPGTTTEFSIEIDPLVSNPFQYFASTTVSGDLNFCDAIEATLTQGTGELYQGPLGDMRSATTTATTTLSLAASISSAFYNSVCDFELDFNGWQTRHGLPTMTGFSDTEGIQKHLASWGLRLNKVYYDVAPDRGVEGDNEWVEIYNQTDVALDISGWEICDNTACDEIPAGTQSVPAGGYAVITNKPGTFSSTSTAPWYLPPGVVYIPLNENIGNGLHNDADMLILKRPDGVILDQMNYGVPDTAWPNWNADVWDPGVTDVAEGHLLARVPSGYDTDQQSDWHDIAPPALDLTYPDEGGSYTWYWNYTYEITWTATNPNGPNSDLDIALFYVMDDDHSGSITPADTVHTITLDTANDGKYKWKVPSGFLGYIWIKIVATGPENPLNNTRSFSGRIYDPEPIFIGPEGMDPADIDLEPPTITVNGNNPAVVAVGSAYSDLGATVTDNVTSNLGVRVTGDEIDTSVAGVYEVLYEAVDQAGNTGMATRIVVVYDPAAGEPDLFAYLSSHEPAPAEPEESADEIVPVPTSSAPAQEVPEADEPQDAPTVLRDEDDGDATTTPVLPDDGTNDNPVPADEAVVEETDAETVVAETIEPEAREEDIAPAEEVVEPETIAEDEPVAEEPAETQEPVILEVPEEVIEPADTGNPEQSLEWEEPAATEEPPTQSPPVTESEETEP